MPQAIREKRAGEKYPVGTDIAYELGTETIQSVTAVVDTGLTAEGVAAFSGTLVTQWVSGGTAGNYYLVTFTVTTNAGSIIVRPVIVRVIADVKPTPVDTTINLVTLDDAKAMIGKTTDEDTAVIEMLINGISTQFNIETGRTLKETTYATVYFDGNGQKCLSLPNYPVASIGTVVEDDVTLTEGEDYDYLLYTSNNDAYLYRIGGFWTLAPKGIKLTSYKAGFPTIPADLKMACLKQVGAEFDRYMKKDWATSAITFPDGSLTRIEAGLLPDVRKVLDRYRRIGG
jgi:hypothetical protein